ncbi:hypothetical protein ACWCWQ_19685 [Streptomyces sp. NPDC001571]
MSTTSPVLESAMIKKNVPSCRRLTDPAARARTGMRRAAPGRV